MKQSNSQFALYLLIGSALVASAMAACSGVKCAKKCWDFGYKGLRLGGHCRNDKCYCALVGPADYCYNLVTFNDYCKNSGWCPDNSQENYCENRAVEDPLGTKFSGCFCKAFQEADENQNDITIDATTENIPTAEATPADITESNDKLFVTETSNEQSSTESNDNDSTSETNEVALSTEASDHLSTTDASDMVPTENSGSESHTTEASDLELVTDEKEPLDTSEATTETSNEFIDTETTSEQSHTESNDNESTSETHEVILTTEADDTLPTETNDFGSHTTEATTEKSELHPSRPIIIPTEADDTLPTETNDFGSHTTEASDVEDEAAVVTTEADILSATENVPISETTEKSIEHETPEDIVFHPIFSRK